jgi:hypothetical protein
MHPEVARPEGGSGSGERRGQVEVLDGLGERVVEITGNE